MVYTIKIWLVYTYKNGKFGNRSLAISPITLRMANSPTFQPIGSMYAIYGNIYHQYTPVMLAYNYTSTTDAMGYGKHIKTVDHFPRETTACRSLITVTLYTGGLEDGNISNCLLAVIV